MQQWQYQILAEPIDPTLYANIPMPDKWLPHCSLPAPPPPETWHYESVWLVTSPAEVPLAEIRLDSWYVEQPQQHATEWRHHAAFYGDPWLEPNLYQVPTVVEWWNKTLDLMPVLDTDSIPQVSFIWFPEAPTATVPSMATWFHQHSQPVLATPATDGVFTMVLPPDVTTTTPDCPHRMPRSDDVDELRFRTH